MKNNLFTKQLINKKRFWAALLVAQFFLFYIVSKSDVAIALLSRVFQMQKKFHQMLFAWIPFSVGDILYVLTGIFVTTIVIKLCTKKNREKSLSILLRTLNAIYFLYQIFWGFLYFEQPLLNHFDTTKDITKQQLKELTELYLNKCILTRSKVSEDQNGVFISKNHDNVVSEILNQQNTIPKFAFKQPTNIISVKNSVFGRLMNFSGILGYYNPFTAEAQYNANLPYTNIPFTIAHEVSHQLGYAREQEANFVGYLLGINSKNADLKYSTELFVLRSLLNNLYEYEPNYVEQIIQQYSPAMKRDRDFDIKFRNEHQGWLEDFFGMTNDWFLKSNQQDGSITYSYFVELLLRYELQEQKKESR